MTNNKLNILALFTILFITQSCSFNEFENSNRIIDISNEIELLLLPDLVFPNQLKWVISTEENRYCESAFIETQLINREQTQSLLIKGIISPSNCVDNDTRLIAIESFPISERYAVDLDFANDLSSKIDLTLEGNTLDIEHANVDYFSFNQSSLKFSSNNLVWVGINENSLQTKAILSEFLQNELSIYELSTLGNGDYGYVFQDDELNYVINPFDYKKYENFLAYEMPSEVDYENFRELILEFTLNLRLENPELDFFVATSKGDIF